MNSIIFRADLHIHTCLSPCGDLEMGPLDIVEQAIRMQLDIIAISDHNSIQNVRGVQDAAAKHDLMVIPAMEITTREEVHILALFESIEIAELVQNLLYADLGKSDNENYIQDQIIVNGDNEVEGFCDQLLMNATNLTVRKCVRLVKEHNGIAIAAHIDRQAFGIIGQLGFIPPKVEFDALEVSRHTPLETTPEKYSQYTDYTFITNSDAHYLVDLGRVFTGFKMPTRSFENIRNALKGINGCSVERLFSHA